MLVIGLFGQQIDGRSVCARVFVCPRVAGQALRVASVLVQPTLTSAEADDLRAVSSACRAVHRP